MEVVKQLGYLYDSTGLIDKHKNIYYNPTDLTITTPFRWVESFESKAKYNDNYYGIDLSSWSPEDRVIRVKGQIDDFRNYITGALILNYLIVKRLDSSNNVKAYIGFFIDSVTQAGLGSVELSITPDYFTNTFFFNVSGYDPFNTTIKNAYIERQHYNRVKKYNNEEEIDGINTLLSNVYYVMNLYEVYNKTVGTDDEPLQYFLFFGNEKTKVKYTHYAIDGTHSYEGKAPFISFAVKTDYGLSIRFSSSSSLSGDLYEDFIQLEELIESAEDSRLHFTTNANYSYTTGTFTDTYLTCITNSYYYGSDNLDLFATTDEKFRFRYQYKDYKAPLLINQYDLTSFSQEELDLISNNSYKGLFSFNEDLIKKIVKCCIYWYVVMTKKSIAMPYMIKTGGQTEAFWSNTVIGQYGKLQSNLTSNIQYLAFPTVRTPEIFKSFKNDLENLYFDNYINFYEDTSQNNYPNLVSKFTINRTYTRSNFSDFYFYSAFLGKKTANVVLNDLITLFGSYIHSIYIVKDINVNYNISVDFSNSLLTCNFESALVETKTYPSKTFSTMDLSERLINGWISNDETTISNYIAVSGYYPNENYIYPKLDITTTDIICSNYTEVGVTIPVFILNGQDKSLYNKLEINGIVTKDYKNDYFDTILTFEPYQYYSISTNELNEVILNKSKYYMTFADRSYWVDIDYSFSVTAGLKIAYVIKYEVENKLYPYYNDSLIFTSNASLPFMSETYFSYLYQNMATMKNQYALAEKNGWEDIVQRTLWSSPINVGVAAGKGIAKDIGGLSAATQTLQEVGGIVDDSLDLAQNIRNIQETQKAQYAGVGAKPNTLKETATDIIFESNCDEICCYLNHYNIDTLSYNSICKYLERYGYEVNIYDTLNTSNRKGWNYIKLVSFDIVKSMSLEQENAIRSIFKNGVTLLHNPEYMDSATLHNYEVDLDNI